MFLQGFEPVERKPKTEKPEHKLRLAAMKQAESV